MIKGLAVFICLMLMLSCSSDNINSIKIEKEYHINGRLKTITYHFSDDDIKIIGFTSKGILDFIYNITNQGHNNFMFVFDSNGRLIMIEPHKNDLQNGKSIWFNSEGYITTENEYTNGKLIKQKTLH